MILYHDLMADTLPLIEGNAVFFGKITHFFLRSSSLWAVRRNIALATLAAACDAQRTALLTLIDADAAGFLPLQRAYAIPKEDPSRGEVMERCLRDAAAAPMEILRLCCEAIDLHSEMLDKGSVMVLSDVGTGAVLCWGALYGAWLNVKVNTKSMADRPYAEAMNDEADGLVEQYWKRAEQIYESVMGRYT